MNVWHQKTMHKKFKYGVPAIFILNKCNENMVYADPNQKHGTIHIGGIRKIPIDAD